MKKTLICVTLAAMMALSCVTPALAVDIDTAGGTGTTPVVLNVTPAVFSVTVPTALPVTMDADGAISVADNAKIINNSVGAVRVADVEVSAVNGWSLIDFNTDRDTLLVDAKQVGLELNGTGTTADGYEFVASDWNVMAATDGADGGADECAVVYDAILPIQTSVITDATIAEVVFTITWNK